MTRFTLAALSAAVLALTGCQSGPRRGDPPMPIASYVDLPKFMGDWYVHGYTPTILDPNAYNPVESYALDPDGSIATTYQFNKDRFDGPQKTYHPRAKIFDKTSNAEWRMRFFGVITSPYLILYVSDDYQETVVAHPNRKMAWIMTRSPTITAARYAALKKELETRNFDLSDLVRAQHQSPGKRPD